MGNALEHYIHSLVELEQKISKEEKLKRIIEEMKTIIIGRGESIENKVLKNGDVLDSDINVRDANEVLLYECENVNTDPTTGYKGGILAEGEYFAIYHWHKGKYPALKIFNQVDVERLERIKRSSNLTRAERTLPSNVGNPNHKGEFIIQDVNIHKCGDNSDWSHGCITIYYRNWDEFMKCFEVGEIVRVILK